MNLEMLALPEKNKVMQAYTNDPEFLHTYFDYNVEESSFYIRNKELSERVFQRSELKEVLSSFMKPFGLSDAARKHIDELAIDGVAVVGGQQAGLLTGPLYSVHKAISVILLAKQQRELLGVPVVPVFWVAGEDHDLNEINHVHTVADYRISKKQYREKYVLKLMASDATFKQDQMAEFVKEIFGTYGETVYTKELLAELIKISIPAATRRTGGHPAKRVFQAIRIAVNDELGAAEDSLSDAITLLNSGGRLSVITFHSLEDRLCKTIFKEASSLPELPPNLPIIPEGMEPIAKLITRKPIIPSEDEVETNKRARSAKLRILEKI